MLFPIKQTVVAVGILLSAASSLAQDFSMDRHRLAVDQPAAVALRMADMDGDGLLDLVRLADRSLTVLLQDQGGGFAAVDTGVRPGGSFLDVAVGDLGSGGSDLAVLSDDGEVAIILNQGSGSFSLLAPSPVILSEAGPATQLLVTDLDGNGGDDVIVVLDGGPQLLHVFLGDGNGGFTDISATQVPENALLSTVDPHIALADCDGDGDPDLVIASPWTEPVLLDNHLNTLGELSVNSEAFPDGAPFAKRVAVADLVGDPLLDLVFGLPGPGATTPELWMNSGAGFANVPVPSSFQVEDATELFAADVDGDLIEDLIALHSEGSVFVGKGDAQGSFAEATQILPPAPRIGLAIGDLDNDGDLDVATAGSGFEDQLLLGRGDGTFLDTEAIDFPIGTAAAGHFGALVDVDYNGDPDVVMIDRDGASTWFRNDGSPRFVEGGPGRVPSLPLETGYHSLTRASVEAPGRRQLVIAANPGASRPLRILGNSVGGFEDQTDLRFPAFGGLSDVVAVASGQVVQPADGLDDLVLADGAGQLHLARNSGGVYSLVAGAFPVVAIADPSRILLGDIDNDGDSDAVVLDPGAQIRLFAGSDAGLFAEPFAPIPVSARNGLLVDLDEDGNLDMILVRPTVELIILTGNGDGSFSDMTEAMMTHHPRGHITDLEMLAANPEVADSRPSLILGVGNLADQILHWDGSRFGPPIDLPYRGSEQTTALLVGDVDREGDQDLVTLRRRTLPALLRNADSHMSITSVSQIGRSLGMRFVTPAPDSGVFIFFGPTLPAIPWAYGILRINPLHPVISFLIPGGRDVTYEWPLPSTIGPGTPAFQAVFVDPQLNIKFSNLEFIILTDH